MPTSNLAVAPAVLYLVSQIAPRRVLDVGPGWGKYGILLREYCGVNAIDAVEAWEPYVTPKVRAIYDEVLVRDVVTLAAEEFAPYDLVLMVDVIEHLSKQDGLEVLTRIPGRVVVCTPMEFFSNGEGLPWTETHRSHWTREDFGDRVEADVSQIGGLILRLAPQ